jgi:hypothetical protein
MENAQEEVVFAYQQHHVVNIKVLHLVDIAQMIAMILDVVIALDVLQVENLENACLKVNAQEQPIQAYAQEEMTLNAV